MANAENRLYSEGHGFELLIMSVLSVTGYYLLKQLMKSCGDTFVRNGFAGVDMSKKEKKQIPEAQGVLCGTIYLIIIFLFIPIAFRSFLFEGQADPKIHNDTISDGQTRMIAYKNQGLTPATAHISALQFIQFLAALLSICCMVFLGFADDALNLRWRHKLVLPTIASLPLLMVYLVNVGTTTIVVPMPLRACLGRTVDIGFLYYIYMGMLAVFCTNAINIYAGINGLEAGQSIVIAISIIIFNLIEMQGPLRQMHLFSLYFLIPYVAVCWPLLKMNWYPASVFVGDTFCYFSGMTFAVVGILGHFSKTLLLFFIPQIVNFIYSTPQLFRLIPCPRHRLPRYDPDTDLQTPSTVEFRVSSLPRPGRLVLRLLLALRLVSCRERRDGKDDTDPTLEINNLTVINAALRVLGPRHESRLTTDLLLLQGACSLLAFAIRYPLASLFYET